MLELYRWLSRLWILGILRQALKAVPRRFIKNKKELKIRILYQNIKLDMIRLLVDLKRRVSTSKLCREKKVTHSGIEPAKFTLMWYPFPDWAISVVMKIGV